jgi:deazaflavin-dependent oxidoreductase (nitroreductase family)
MAVPKVLARLGTAITNSLYRASGGRVMGTVRGMPVLLITIAGRKTGAMHTTPVLYLEDDGEYVVIGSGSGSAKEPQWFKNLRRADDAEIQVRSRRLAVNVDVVEGAQREILWQRLLVRAPFFGDYQRKVRRQIPMAILMPKP